MITKSRRSAVAAAFSGISLIAGLLVTGGIPAAQAEEVDPPPVSVSVTVVNGDDSVVGAQVVLLGLDGDQPRYDFYYENRTQPDGAATFELTSGEGSPAWLYVLATPPSNYDDTMAAAFVGVVPFPNDGETIPVSLPRANRIYEVTSDGVPLSGVNVDISRPVAFDGEGDNRYVSQQSTILQGQTDDAGQFAIRIEDGNTPLNSYPGFGWIVRVSGSEAGVYGTVQFDDTLAGDLVMPIDLPLANVRGFVTGLDGDLYQRAQVSLRKFSSDQWGCWSDQVDSTQVNGNLEWPGDDTFGFYTDSTITPDGYQVVIEPPMNGSGTFDDTSVAITVFDRSLEDTSTSLVREFQFAAPNLVTQVRDTENNPIDDARVTVRLAEGDPCFSRDFYRTQDGGFAYLHVPQLSSPADDTYVLEVSVNDQRFLSRTLTGVEIVEQMDDSGSVLLQPDPANLIGTVDDSSGGDLAGARVEVISLNDQGWFGEGRVEATTDDSGQFGVAIDPATIPHGFAVRITAPNDDFSRGAPIELNRDDTGWDGVLNLGSIQLPAANAQGTLFGEGGDPLGNVFINGWTSNGTQIAGMNTLNQDDNRGSFGVHIPGTVSRTSPANLGVYLQEEQRFVQFDIEELSLDLQLRVPQVNLDVQIDPPLPGASISLFTSTDGFEEWLSQAFTDESGVAQFAVDDTTIPYIVEVQPPADSQLATTRVEATPTAIPSEPGKASILVELAEPNALVTVVDELGDPLSNAFVYVRQIDAMQGVQALTDATGIARLVVDDTSALFDIIAGPPWEDRRSYTETRVETTFDTSGPKAQVTVALGSPNLELQVNDPGGQPLPHAQLDVAYTGDLWSFLWLSADQQGVATLNLEAGFYQLNVGPSTWQSGASAFGLETYAIEVTEEGDVLVRDDSGIIEVDEEGRVPVAVSFSQFTGSVEAGGQPVGNAWVEVLREMGTPENSYLEWVTGTSTGRDGTFGLSLADDTYVVVANPRWGDRTYAPSAECTLVVSGGAVDNSIPGSCDDTLYLRSPNLIFEVTDGTDPVFNAWACPINTGSFRCVSSGVDGQVALFIDDTPSILDDSIIIQIDPPYGSTELAGVTIEVPKSQVGQSPWDGTEVVALAVPNVTITVMLAGVIDDTASDGWVSIFREDGEWIGGSPVSRLGRASFNLDDTTGEFCVEVWPGWNVRRDYGPTVQCGITLSDGGEPVTLTSANVRTVVVDPEGRLNSYGWVQIENQDDAGAVTGVPLNETGRLATYLAGDDTTTYTLTFYPSWGRGGTPTRVEVTVVDGVADIPDQVTLSSGNVTGEVLVDAVLTEGVIVVATSGSDSYTAVTGSSGEFVLGVPSGSYTVTVVAPPDVTGEITFTSVTGGNITGSDPWALTVGS